VGKSSASLGDEGLARKKRASEKSVPNKAK